MGAPVARGTSAAALRPCPLALPTVAEHSGEGTPLAGAAAVGGAPPAPLRPPPNRSHFCVDTIAASGAIKAVGHYGLHAEAAAAGAGPLPLHGPFSQLDQASGGGHLAGGLVEERRHAASNIGRISLPQHVLRSMVSSVLAGEWCCVQGGWAGPPPVPGRSQVWLLSWMQAQRRLGQGPPSLHTSLHTRPAACCLQRWGCQRAACRRP